MHIYLSLGIISGLGVFFPFLLLNSLIAKVKRNSKYVLLFLLINIPLIALMLILSMFQMSIDTMVFIGGDIACVIALLFLIYFVIFKRRRVVNKNKKIENEELYKDYDIRDINKEKKRAIDHNELFEGRSLSDIESEVFDLISDSEGKNRISNKKAYYENTLFKDLSNDSSEKLVNIENDIKTNDVLAGLEKKAGEISTVKDEYDDYSEFLDEEETRHQREKIFKSSKRKR